jgi:hypothetical protein
MVLKSMNKSLGVAAAPFRVALAFVVLFVFAIQPVSYTQFGTSQVSGTKSSALSGHIGHMSQDEHHAAAHRHKGIDSHKDSPEHGSDPDYKLAETCCDVQCSPVHAVPVVCPEIVVSLDRGFEPMPATSLPLGEYGAAVRPPRTLI